MSGRLSMLLSRDEGSESDYVSGGGGSKVGNPVERRLTVFRKRSVFRFLFNLSKPTDYCNLNKFLTQEIKKKNGTQDSHKHRCKLDQISILLMPAEII